MKTIGIVALVAGVFAVLLLAPRAIVRASAPAGRYVVSGGTVFDTKTKLTWEQANAFMRLGSNLVTAKAYCASAALAALGADTWRVPTVKELMTLVDTSVASPGPTIDTTAFPNTPGDYFGTSTPHAGDASTYWLINFTTGAPSSIVDDIGKSVYVRCVH